MGETMRIRSQADLATGLEALLGIDPRLHAIAREAGPLPLRLTEPGFEGLAFIIVSQMVSRASADAIWRRLCGAMGIADPAAYLALGDAALSLGLSRAKHACLSGLATAAQAGDIDLLAILDQPVEAGIAELTRLRGIGLWTSEVYLMFCGGHADVFPAGDVALRAAVGDGLCLAARPDIRETTRIALAWRPYRAIAARLFWAFYAARLRREAAPVPV
ncbi:DNA-3-methyladenine glycosylase 2 family protein [Agrobacterium vitis]|uniref:DNA-3-methyladenine glycosylase II n=1 Tax=Agrobacterium vitis TaxID=373 RepID=A0AAE4WFA4_AGRVI|nr:DNA-3-methyladenine glycosylase 2 family protein [Agrobacterium vitis]MCF1498013.1 DNA-3-methyladenine glycosylase 2 family protein [Allorhizobium sp. Av2]MCM2440135.1 DNA-3-methyladenine glycosylase 2 family protein [Agrobacterium vitis]MUZ57932.1 DNA-3-methyladenine glycosylase 2 family protein [Agrobacterium vitis]MVA67478.1 DNA-3-methyladenine glycosylase 2 family protein [Agrobacterium vitis]MVA86812.1 DNA-3-methyladenine glycosylase 2 family protein [Agrobacterium vitis]